MITYCRRKKTFDIKTKVQYLNSVGKNDLWEFIRILYTTKKELSLGEENFTLIYQFVLNQLQLISPTCERLMQVRSFPIGLVKKYKNESDHFRWSSVRKCIFDT